MGISVHPAMPLGWTAALPIERCDYHWRRPAVYSWYGTPLCAACAEASGLELAPERTEPDAA